MATLQLFGKLGANAFGGEVLADASQMDYLSDVMKWTLHTVTYVPNIDTNEAYNADTPNELATASGYTVGGYTLTTKTVSYNATGNITTFDCDDITVTASGGTLTFQIGVLHDDSVATGPPIKPLIGYSDLGAQAITTGNSFVIQTGANGLWQNTVT